MADTTFTDGEVEAFVAKLNAVDFSEKERSLLRGIVAAAIPGEVEGFDASAPAGLTPAQKDALKNWDPNSVWPPSGGPKGSLLSGGIKGAVSGAAGGIV